METLRTGALKMSFLTIQNNFAKHFETPVTQSKTRIACGGIWDVRQARFTRCTLPFIAAIPAAAAVFVVIGAAVRLSPWTVPVPKWLRPFVVEPAIRQHGLAIRDKYHFRLRSYLLLLLASIGLSTQIAAGLFPLVRRDMVFPTTAWLAMIALLIIEHSATVPYSILILNVLVLTSQLIIYVDGTLELDGGFNLSHMIVLTACLSALASIVVIFLMPMRHPMLLNDDISAVFTNPTSALRSPEDNLSLWQWCTASWVAPLLHFTNTEPALNNENVWDLGYEFKHALLHKTFRQLEGSVLKRLMIANGRDLLITATLSILRVMCSLSYPLLLQQILRTLQDEDSPREATLKYAILSLAVETVANQVDLFTTWYGRRGYERSRGEMITMLYEKSLSRKVVSVSSKPRTSLNATRDSIHAEDSKLSYIQRFVAYLRSCIQRKPKKTKEELEQEKAEDMASTGKIMNLMRSDAYEVAQLIWDFSDVVQAPIRLVLCAALIWKLLGPSCLLAGTTVVIAQIIHVGLAKASIPWSKARRAASDTKIHKVSEVVESIRHLRWYGWQDVWLTRIMEARTKELNLRVMMYMWSTLINLFNTFASGMFPVIAFYGYTIFSGRPLTVDIAFPALQLFNLLEWNLQEIPYYIQAYLNAWVAMGRIESFMQEPDKEDGEDGAHSTGEINMEETSFAWPGASDPTLREISIKMSTGLNVICGEVGSGKSALLLAILGEMDQKSGTYHRTNEIIAYCGIPWLQSMSIRDNILFSAHFDEERYQQVLEACALVPDMVEFKHGDKSLIGENGIGLSGGQRARVSLARAVYSQARILLLDDPLAALDHQTAEWIVRKCLKGPLLQDRTIVLVTHRVALCLGVADRAYEISIEGRAKPLDPKSSPYLEAHSDSSAQDDTSDAHADDEKGDSAPEKFMEEEHRSKGGVKLSVYWEYVKAGKLRWWLAVVIIVSLLRLVDVGETWFLKEWGEAYGGKITKGPFGELPAPYVNIRPWLIGFFLFAVAHSLAFLITQTFMLVVVYNSGKELFARVMKKCTHATFRFYDVTPVGMLMNRLTSDINTVDGDISNQLRSIVSSAVAWISAIVVIASVTPLFLFVSLIMAVLFVLTFRHFLPTSQGLRRLEMVSLTPLISNFGEVTAGLTTIRAYGASARFQARVVSVTDTFQSLDHFYWSVQAWLMIRFDNLSSIGTFIVTVLAIYTGVSAGLTAFVLNAAEKFVWSTQQLCRKYGQLQMDFVSVERVVELLNLEQESPGEIDPPAYWPSLGGDIVFDNVTIRYASYLEPALQNISVTIKGGSTTALIGRTGSGKSTLALSLLATTPPSEGTILIDGIDISKVSKQTLRQRITFLAQDPVLFPGTMRENLDPLNEFSDDECLQVLTKIADRHQWTLDAHIDTGGKNLSQGQRQLVGLARAILRRSAIIIMDEATASIDMETALRIQEILRVEMSGSTVVTIAHRVEAVKDAQRCIVLGKGKVIEEGAAGEVGLAAE